MIPSMRPAPALVLISLLICASAAAQDGDYRLRLDFGYRWKVNFNGSEDLYRSQVDLGEGPKLFGGDLFWTRPEDSGGLFDHLEVRMNSWGGEPYNTAQVLLGKDGVYELRFHYQNVQYFNAVPSFANPAFSSGLLLTQHRYETERKNLGFDLLLRPGKTVSPFVSYQRSSHKGPSSTTMTLGQDEFLLGVDSDLRSDQVSGGVRLTFSKAAFRFEQGVRWFRDDTVFSGQAQTGNSGRPFFGEQIELDSYRGRTDFEATIPFSRATATYEPWNALTLRAEASYALGDLDGSFSESATGNFFSFPELAAFFGGRDVEAVSDAKQPNLGVEVSAEWRVNDFFSVVERIGTERFHTSGFGLLDSTFSDVAPVLSPPVDRLQTGDSIPRFIGLDFDRQELAGHFRPTDDLQFHVGYRYEHRELELSPERIFTWNRDVLVVGGAYRFSSRNRVSVDYEFGRTDRQILRLDPVDFDRLRIRVVLSPFERLELRGSMSLFDHDDEPSATNLVSKQRDYSVQVSYTPADWMDFSGEYGRSRINTNVLFIIPQTFTSDNFIYNERGDYGNLYLNFSLIRNSRLTLGYSVWGNQGNFPVNYHQPYAELEIPVGEQFSVYGRYKYYDYNEKVGLFPQDYRTHLIVLGFRLNFNKRQP